MLYPVDVLPANLEAERLTLGCVILDNGVAPQVIPVLDVDAYSFEANRLIFTAMRNLYRDNRAINPLTLQEELRRTGEIESVGGAAYLASLFDGAPRFSDVTSYVCIVQEKATRRRAMRLANWLFNEAQGVDVRVEDLLASLSGKVAELQEGQAADDLISSQSAVERTMEEIELRWTTGREIIGLPTGFPDLDRTLRGLRGGKYYTVAACTGLGKTTLALNFADNIARNPGPDGGRVGLIISLEMSVDELTVKQLSTATRIDADAIETGKLNETAKASVREAAELLKRIPIEYVEGFAKVTAGSLMARVEKVRRKHKRLDFLVVDYLQLLDADERKENEHQKLSEISRTLKRIARMYNIPVIVLSQLNREYAKRANKDHQLSDLRGSGSVEQDSDVVMFLMPQDWADEENPGRRLFIAKHRGGKKNVTIPLVFFGAQSRFESAAITPTAEPDGLGGWNEWPPVIAVSGNGNGSGKRPKNRSDYKSIEREIDEYCELM